MKLYKKIKLQNFNYKMKDKYGKTLLRVFKNLKWIQILIITNIYKILHC